MSANSPSAPPVAAPAAGSPTGAPGSGGRARAMGGQARVAVAVIVVAALAALFWPRDRGAFEPQGGFLVDGTGRAQTLGPRLAPVTLVHFWATWCPPCMQEIPALDRLIADYADRPGFDVVMIAVDDVKEKVETFAGDRAAMMLYDPNWEVAHGFGTKQLPETYLVVKTDLGEPVVPTPRPIAGRAIERWEGAVNWDDPQIRRRLDDVLARATGDRGGTAGGAAPAAAAGR